MIGIKRYLKQHGALKEEQAMNILKDILFGFRELIRNGIIHRDLKPANILISNDV